MLRNIFTLCRSIELAAEAVYLKISEQSVVDEQKSFWLEISQDEKRHAKYWEQLLDFQRKGALTNLFDNPELIADELNTMKHKYRLSSNLEMVCKHSIYSPTTTFETTGNLIQCSVRYFKKVDPEHTVNPKHDCSISR